MNLKCSNAEQIVKCGGAKSIDPTKSLAGAAGAAARKS